MMPARGLHVSIARSRKKKSPKLFDKVVQVSEKTDPEYADKATRRNIAAYKACRSERSKREFMENLPSEERRVLRKWAEGGIA
jgi:hypothetical protein